MKITKQNIAEVEKQLKISKHEAVRLERKLYQTKQGFFIQNATRPIYDYKKFRAPELNIASAHETQTIWHDTGTISGMTHKNVEIWVCKFCKIPARKKYIATGHDHTDYSYDVCDCDGARKFGKKYSELK